MRAKDKAEQEGVLVADPAPPETIESAADPELTESVEATVAVSISVAFPGNKAASISRGVKSGVGKGASRAVFANAGIWKCQKVKVMCLKAHGRSEKNIFRSLCTKLQIKERSFVVY